MGTHTNGAIKDDNAERYYPNIKWSDEVDEPVPVFMDSHYHHQCGHPPLPSVNSPRSHWIGSWTDESDLRTEVMEPIELNVNSVDPIRKSWREFARKERLIRAQREARTRAE